jgi:hypothetical protein
MGGHASVSTTVGSVSRLGDQGSGPSCQDERHASCPHNIGGGVHPFPRQNRAVATLCTCSCHGTCPIGSQREISNEEWLRECTCSGSNALGENLNQMKETADARRSQREEVFRDINFAHGKSAAQIQREILAAYDAKGYAAPTDFSRISRFAAANTARRGTRTARLLIEIVGSLHAVRRWAESNISGNDHPRKRGGAGTDAQKRGCPDGTRCIRCPRCVLHQRFHPSWPRGDCNTAGRPGGVGWTVGVRRRLDHPTSPLAGRSDVAHLNVARRMTTSSRVHYRAHKSNVGTPAPTVA